MNNEGSAGVAVLPPWAETGALSRVLSVSRHSASVCQDPRVDGPWDVPAGDTLTLKARLPVPSVLLVHVCARPEAVPDQVSKNAHNST